MGNSHQRGWVVARGKHGYYRKEVFDPTTNQQKIDIVPVVLGPKSQITKFKARELLEQEIAKNTGKSLGGRVMNDSSVAFGWFVRNRFLPLKEAKWRPETAKVKKLIIQKVFSNHSMASLWKTLTGLRYKSTSTNWALHVARTQCCKSRPT